MLSQQYQILPERASGWSLRAPACADWSAALFQRYCSIASRDLDTVADDPNSSVTVRECVQQQRFPPRFPEEFLAPLIAATWGLQQADMMGFPIYNVARVMGRFGARRYTYCVLDHGLSSYVDRLASEVRAVELRLGREVKAVRRNGGAIFIEDGRGVVRSYEQLVLATARRLFMDLGSPEDHEK